MKMLGKLAIILAVIGLMLAIIFFVTSQDRKEIDAWAEKYGYSVESVDSRAFETGPFYMRSKNDRVYRVVVRDGLGRERVMWFRFSLWTQQAWED